MKKNLSATKSIVLFCGLSLLILFVVSCGQGEPKKEKPMADTSMAMKADTVKQYPIALVDNKKDPSCGMPLTAGIGDTAHYKGKTIGFCSAECKAAFEKNPEAGIVAAELKK
jgi:YHS domain-containing protein